MIVKHLEEIVDTKDDIDTTTWNSRRLLLTKDGMGFSLNDTLIKAGTETLIWYKTTSRPCTASRGGRNRGCRRRDVSHRPWHDVCAGRT